MPLSRSRAKPNSILQFAFFVRQFAIITALETKNGSCPSPPQSSHPTLAPPGCCSWRLSAGCDAVIEASFFGTRGSVRLRNVNGSFYDFHVEHCEGTRTRALAVPANSWGAVPICEWARQLAEGAHFRREAEQLTEVHRVLDAIYGR